MKSILFVAPTDKTRRRIIVMIQSICHASPEDWTDTDHVKIPLMASQYRAIMDAAGMEHDGGEPAPNDVHTLSTPTVVKAKKTTAPASPIYVPVDGELFSAPTPRKRRAVVSPKTARKTTRRKK